MQCNSRFIFLVKNWPIKRRMSISWMLNHTCVLLTHDVSDSLRFRRFKAHIFMNDQNLNFRNGTQKCNSVFARYSSPQWYLNSIVVVVVVVVVLLLLLLLFCRSIEILAAFFDCTAKRLQRHDVIIRWSYNTLKFRRRML